MILSDDQVIRVLAEVERHLDIVRDAHAGLELDSQWNLSNPIANEG